MTTKPTGVQMEDGGMVQCAICGEKFTETDTLETTSGPLCRACYGELKVERDGGESGAVAVVAVRVIGYGGLVTGLLAGGSTWNPLFVLAGVFAVISGEMAARLMW